MKEKCITVSNIPAFRIGICPSKSNLESRERVIFSGKLYRGSDRRSEESGHRDVADSVLGIQKVLSFPYKTCVPRKKAECHSCVISSRKKKERTEKTSVDGGDLTYTADQTLSVVDNANGSMCTASRTVSEHSTITEGTENLTQSSRNDVLAKKNEKRKKKVKRKSKSSVAEKQVNNGSKTCKGIYSSNSNSHDLKWKTSKHVLKSGVYTCEISAMLRIRTAVNHNTMDKKKSKVASKLPLMYPKETKAVPNKRISNKNYQMNTQCTPQVSVAPTIKRHSPRKKVFLSEKQSSDKLGIPSNPPSSPDTEYLHEIQVVQSLSDVKAQRQLKSTLARLEAQQRAKLEKQREIDQEKMNKLEKNKEQEEKRKLKQQQRAEIYALNQILAAIECRKFEEMKSEKAAVPV